MTGDEIRTTRERLGWSRLRMAVECQVGFETIGRWERGENVPLPIFQSKLQQLAHAVPDARSLREGRERESGIVDPGGVDGESHPDDQT